MAFLTDEELNNIRKQTEKTFQCDHPLPEIRYRTNKLGQKRFYLQCMRCGTTVEHLRKYELSREQMEGCHPFEENISDNFYSYKSKYYNHLRESALLNKKNEFYNWYHNYLLSPKWQKKRELVFKRAQYLCEGCGRNKATEVHHLNYHHLGDELLFELVAVCDECHSKIHKSI